MRIGYLFFATLVLATPSAHGSEAESSIARGGMLYDKWFSVIGASAPKSPNPQYPKGSKYYGKGGADYRCKECHGWDYQGKDGAYRGGKHFTGIKGIRAMAGADPAKVVAVLKDKTHGYGKLLGEKDLKDLALFVSKGQVDMDRVIDRTSKKAKGDAGKGAGYYNTVCAKCHGTDGKHLSKMPPMGKLASGNPWETLHKILNGQPDEEMPALRAFGLDEAVDILTYAQTLPQK